ncbi:MAG: SBBP repeat-containing protein [Candidatus Thorarchaeota archaeon]
MSRKFVISKKLRREALSIISLLSLLLLPGIVTNGYMTQVVVDESLTWDWQYANHYPEIEDHHMDETVPTRVLSDTLVCAFSSYLGGSDSEISDRARFGIAVDVTGNAFITGSTASTDFPTKNAYQ